MRIGIKYATILALSITFTAELLKHSEFLSLTCSTQYLVWYPYFRDYLFVGWTHKLAKYLYFVSQKTPLRCMPDFPCLHEYITLGWTEFLPVRCSGASQHASPPFHHLSAGPITTYTPKLYTWPAHLLRIQPWLWLLQRLRPPSLLEQVVLDVIARHGHVAVLHGGLLIAHVPAPQHVLLAPVDDLVLDGHFASQAFFGAVCVLNVSILNVCPSKHIPTTEGQTLKKRNTGKKAKERKERKKGKKKRHTHRYKQPPNQSPPEST